MALRKGLGEDAAVDLAGDTATPRRGTTSRRGAEALGRGNVVPVAAVVVNPTLISSHPRGFARSREDAKVRKAMESEVSI